MITIENCEVIGWEHAIRGMRNPMNSWEKSDSTFCKKTECAECELRDDCKKDSLDFDIGSNDFKLMNTLANNGSVHAKYRRMITVYVDITAPLYFWKEFDTYKVGTVANSCSTMHKIADREFTVNDFSHEHLTSQAIFILLSVIEELNDVRELYLQQDDKDVKKAYWWQMIQLLPSSYNQRRTIMLNYEVLANIYKYRRNHKLDEWHYICDWIESLPHSEIITCSIKETNKNG